MGGRIMTGSIVGTGSSNSPFLAGHDFAVHLAFGLAQTDWRCYIKDRVSGSCPEIW